MLMQISIKDKMQKIILLYTKDRISYGSGDGGSPFTSFPPPTSQSGSAKSVKVMNRVGGMWRCKAIR